MINFEHPLPIYSTEALGAQNASDQQDTNGLANGSQLPNDDSNTPTTYNQRDMLEEIGETFNITNMSSINNVLRSSSYQDLFSVTLDEFRNLTMSNIVDDSSSDETNDLEELDAINFNEGCNTESDNSLRC